MYKRKGEYLTVKLDVRKIIDYEIEKNKFYKNRNKKIEVIIDDEYCEYEEKKYGDDLTVIYQGLDKIRSGKEYLKSISIMLLTLLSGGALHIFQFKNGINTNSFLFNLNSILLSMLIIYFIGKLVQISKYKEYIRYVCERLKINLRNI